MIVLNNKMSTNLVEIKKYDYLFLINIFISISLAVNWALMMALHVDPSVAALSESLVAEIALVRP